MKLGFKSESKTLNKLVTFDWYPAQFSKKVKVKERYFLNKVVYMVSISINLDPSLFFYPDLSVFYPNLSKEGRLKSEYLD